MKLYLQTYIEQYIHVLRRVFDSTTFNMNIINRRSFITLQIYPTVSLHHLSYFDLVKFGLIHYSAFFGSKGRVALDRNPGTGIRYPTLTIDPRRSFKCMSP